MQRFSIGIGKETNFKRRGDGGEIECSVKRPQVRRKNGRECERQGARPPTLTRRWPVVNEDLIKIGKVHGERRRAVGPAKLRRAAVLLSLNRARQTHQGIAGTPFSAFSLLLFRRPCSLPLAKGPRDGPACRAVWPRLAPAKTVAASCSHGPP